MDAIKLISRKLDSVMPELAEFPFLGEMFRSCFMNTLTTTVLHNEPGDSFVITGDIPAMWLRDSTAQVLHYVRFAEAPAIAEIIEGLLARQAKCVLLDPYANAFNQTDNGAKYTVDQPVQSGWVWERKYEIDSLCSPILLAHRYYEKTKSETIFTEEFHQMIRTIVRVFKTEQDHAASDYYFIRTDCPKSDTLSHDGKGAPVKRTGMTWSGFRPSDDACKYGYLIPSNLFAIASLRQIAEFAKKYGDSQLTATARALAQEIEKGVWDFGLVDHPNHGTIYAYETDGLGHYVLMDDANVPSLLSLPYLGVCDANSALYQRTRSFVLSSDNRFYYDGSLAAGVGSPHTPAGYIWPIALCVQAMTSVDDDEIAALLGMLLQTHGGTHLMHESFDPEDPRRFTREWFAWANSMFGETIYRLHEAGKLPEILKKAKAWQAHQTLPSTVREALANE